MRTVIVFVVIALVVAFVAIFAVNKTTNGGDSVATVTPVATPTGNPYDAIAASKHTISNAMYTVEDDGETFASVAQKYGVDEKTLAAINADLSEPFVQNNGVLMPDMQYTGGLTGQQVYADLVMAEAWMHDTQGFQITLTTSRNTLQDIAAAYRVSMADLIEYNQFTADDTDGYIRAGRGLFIPNKGQ